MATAIAQSPWKLPVLLFLLLLVPGVGLAAEQTPASPEPLPGSASRAPLHLMEEDLPQTEPEESHSVLRIMAELGAELTTSAVAAVAGAYAGDALCRAYNLAPHSSLGCTDYAGYGALVTAILAAPLGVWWGGKLAGGQGTLLGAYLGMGAAAALGLGATLLIYNDDIQPFVIPVFSLVGAIVGYEVSHHSEASARNTSLASVQPTLALSANGGALGLGGRF